MDHFSYRESNIIKILGRKRMTLDEISKELFKTEPKPLDFKNALANSVTRIIKKCAHHKLNWTLFKSRANNRLVIKRVSKEKL